MFQVRFAVPPRQVETASAELWELGTAGVTETELPDGRIELTGFFDEVLPGIHGAWSEVEVRDWATEWRSGWEPLAVGERLWIAPEWDTSETPAGRLRLDIYPGMASGTGLSEPTQLALAALERAVTPGSRVFDWGAGSGILGRAARLLGAGFVAGCDMDPVAARECARFVPCIAGTGRSLAADSVDLIAANLNAITLVSSVRDMRRILRPGGGVITSGYRERRRPMVEAAFTAAGFTGAAQLQAGDWRAAVWQ